ncbi:hypothetical protein NIES2100_79800 (plasmid) [Calothrix sp. NIES-2100]|uniref:hypothetical protein n=1 Tax=Calothrix sp. NIES-2100 TaxID=1954172 RepID=UPI000B60FBD2|nr:hypothetical protein NIES2100_79800 [Calothrix sp. NIES-2100]
MSLNLDEKIFVEQFKILAKHYKYEIHPTIAKIYYKYLSENFSNEEFLQVVEMALIQIPTRMGLPSAQELVDLMKGSRTAQGLLEWQAIRQAAAANDPNMLAYLSKRAHIALSAIGGLETVALTETRKLEWVQKDFLAVYTQSGNVDARMLKPASPKVEPRSKPVDDSPPITDEQWEELRRRIKKIGSNDDNIS